MKLTFTYMLFFIRILSPLALESHRLVSTTPLCFTITTVPGGRSCWNFLFLWINSGAPTSALSSGIVPVSVGADPAALRAWGGFCSYCGRIYRKGDKGRKKANSRNPEVRGLTPGKAMKAKERRERKHWKPRDSLAIWWLITYNLEYLNRRGRHSFRKTTLVWWAAAILTWYYQEADSAPGSPLGMFWACEATRKALVKLRFVPASVGLHHCAVLDDAEMRSSNHLILQI